MTSDRNFTLLRDVGIGRRLRTGLGAFAAALLVACGGSSSDGDAGGGTSLSRPPSTFALGEAPQASAGTPAASGAADGRVAAAPTSAQLAKVLLAQSLVQAADDPELALLGRRDLLVLAQVTNPAREEPTPEGSLKILGASGELLANLPLEPPRGPVPMLLPDSPSFKTAYSVTVPGKHVVPGIRLALDFGGGQVQRTVEPVIGPAHAVTLVTVPIRIGNQTGEVAADMGAAVAARLPFSSVQEVAHPVHTLQSASELPSTAAGWEALFRKVNAELLQLQIAEGAADDLRRFYVGFVPASGAASFGNYATRVAAVGDERGQARPIVVKSVVHELGHALFLSDAPCGAVQDPDKSFPYANGRMGAGSRYTWGFVADIQAFIDPRDTDRHDAMSRCAGDTFSDYNYRKMMSTLATGGWLALR
ncbi:hypothetical protein VARIO8X_150165 [Burkholderiales bacterium 8X]|nr:hypothetical protein VARIO8X_150165 [Burkholderiales bacterium 8X]